MQRFRQMIVEATASSSPYIRPSRSVLAQVGRVLSPSDVNEILDELDRLSEERNSVPAWDGDSTDDIARWMEELTHVLAATTGASRTTLRQGQPNRDPLTRRYIEIALSSPPRQSWWRRISNGLRGRHQG